MRRVFAFGISLLLLSACQVAPKNVTPIEPTRSFAALSCEQLSTEVERIDESYAGLRWSNKAGTRDRLAHLNGEAIAVNDAIHVRDCNVAAVRIPGHAWPESSNGYGR